MGTDGYEAIGQTVFAWAVKDKLLILLDNTVHQVGKKGLNGGPAPT